MPGYAIVTISLKPIGGVPGDASADQMDLVADLAERLSFDEIRVSHEQNLVLAHVKQSDLFALWQKLDAAGLGTANYGLITDIIACPGLDYCDLANARSINIAQAVSQTLRRPRPPAQHRRAEAENLGLHQRLRPPPCRPYRRSRRR